MAGSKIPRSSIGRRMRVPKDINLKPIMEKYKRYKHLDCALDDLDDELFVQRFVKRLAYENWSRSADRGPGNGVLVLLRRAVLDGQFNRFISL